jgi:2-polyprenyl-3-methyl-5-hydroxy-6-metoxy-1,4-benzoquinol methylase
LLQIDALNSRVRTCKGAIVFLPLITEDDKWQERQRQWAGCFAEQGYVSIQVCNASKTGDDAFEQIEPNSFFFHGPNHLLWNIPGLTLWACAGNYNQAGQYPPDSLIIYDCIDAWGIFSGEAEAINRNHERALREATLVICETYKTHKPAATVRSDAILLHGNCAAGPASNSLATDRDDKPHAAIKAEMTRTIAKALWNYKRFQSYLTPQNRAFHHALCKYNSGVPDDNPCLSLYFAYAISTNDRGRAVAHKLAKYAPIQGKRYLDVGCAYAGFLVAMAEKGAKVAGIDINDSLLALGQQNLKDNNLDALVFQCDITKPEDVRPFYAKYDVITCNDVVEHVLNPSQAIQNIADILKSGGTAYFEIPNAHSPQSVLEDPHFHLFGMTLLDHEEAKQYYSHHAPGVEYSVGYYLELSTILELLDKAGIEADLLEENIRGANIQAVLAQAHALQESFPARIKTVPKPFRAHVTDKIHRYLAEIKSAPRNTSEQQRDFLIRYGICVWKILGRKR